MTTCNQWAWISIRQDRMRRVRVSHCGLPAPQTPFRWGTRTDQPVTSYLILRKRPWCGKQVEIQTDCASKLAPQLSPAVSRKRSELCDRRRNQGVFSRQGLNCAQSGERIWWLFIILKINLSLHPWKHYFRQFSMRIHWVDGSTTQKWVKAELGISRYQFMMKIKLSSCRLILRN